MTNFSLASPLLLFALLFIVPCLALCPTNPAWNKPGTTTTFTLASGRSALIRIPTNYNGVDALPLVLHFHGCCNGEPVGYTGWSDKADAANFFVVFPETKQPPPGASWNAGACCSPASDQKFDDVGFVKELLDNLVQNMLCINVNKIYSSGYSNGGFFTYRLGCNETGYSFAAIGVGSGLDSNWGTYPCPSLSRPLPIIDFHGSLDTIVNFQSVNDTIKYWAGKNGCNWNSQTTSFSRSSAICTSLSCPNSATNNITFCTVNGMGHGWAGAAWTPTDIYATDQMWDFFSRFGSAPSCSQAAVGSGTGLTGDYYAATSSGFFNYYLFSRVDATVNFPWGYGSPDARVPADFFDVRWTGKVQPRYSGTYTFELASDDGVRLWVNGQQIINQWVGQGLTSSTGTISLTAGLSYDIVIEYMELYNQAEIYLYWSMNACGLSRQIIPQSQLYPCRSSLNAGGNGLTGSYYTDMTLTTIKGTQVDAIIDANWGGGGPSILTGQVEGFSIKWSGFVQPRYSGLYTFYANSDDGARIYVNGTAVVNEWVNRGTTESSGSIALAQGVKYPITYQYFENGGQAEVHMSWSSSCEAKAIVPQSQLFTA